ncbi:MAG TPA: glucose 1-dehydrogenase [Novosphingobium sp.]|nr:glucose 1-dehydrogenase [Novosphingobium sp.]
MLLFDVSGKVIAVTGSTKGIGRGIVQELAAAGAKVIVSSRKQAECDSVADELNREFGAGSVIAHGLACDLADLDSVKAFTAAAPELFGGLDVLVSNAAVLAWFGPAGKTPPQVFDRMLSGNVHHNMQLCVGVQKAIAARGGGSIILIGSASGAGPMPDILSYSVSKAAVSHLAWNLAELMAPDGIRVNCVAPGLIRSFSSTANMGEAGLAAGARQIPLGRIGEPEDIAGAVIFLASRAGSFVTGETILVDGGRSRLHGTPDSLTASATNVVAP